MQLHQFIPAHQHHALDGTVIIDIGIAEHFFRKFLHRIQYIQFRKIIFLILKKRKEILPVIDDNDLRDPGDIRGRCTSDPVHMIPPDLFEKNEADTLQIGYQLFSYL